MATYVLVHGGGHGGWCYQRVARMLRSAGSAASSTSTRPPRSTASRWLTWPARSSRQSAPTANALPRYHIVCTSTLATRDEDLMREAREAGRLWDIDTGHDLMITEPEAVTNALIEVASA
jgi:hypothetical protein